MKEIKADLWNFHDAGSPIAITTNGYVKKNNTCVMGRGVALQCKNRYPTFPELLGLKIKEQGNHVHMFEQLGLLKIPLIFTFPVKHNWYEKADVDLIRRSMMELQRYVNLLKLNKCYLPKPGCGNGGLNWNDVKTILESYDDRFVVVDL